MDEDRLAKLKIDEIEKMELNKYYLVGICNWNLTYWSLQNRFHEYYITYLRQQLRINSTYYPLFVY